MGSITRTSLRRAAATACAIASRITPRLRAGLHDDPRGEALLLDGHGVQVDGRVHQPHVVPGAGPLFADSWLR